MDNFAVDIIRAFSYTLFTYGKIVFWPFYAVL